MANKHRQRRRRQHEDDLRRERQSDLEVAKRQRSRSNTPCESPPHEPAAAATRAELELEHWRHLRARAVARLREEIEFVHEEWYSAAPIRGADGVLDWFRWQCKLRSLDNSPFGGFVFTLAISFPDSYPSKPPVIEFVTPTRHPNVVQEPSGRGRLYCPMLRTWAQDSWLTRRGTRSLALVHHLRLLLAWPEGGFISGTDFSPEAARAWTEPHAYAGAWSMRTHRLFPHEKRAKVVYWLWLAKQLSALPMLGGTAALLDLWVPHLMPRLMGDARTLALDPEPPHSPERGPPQQVVKSPASVLVVRVTAWREPRHQDLHFKIKSSMLMHKLMLAYCARRGYSLDTARFLFKGRVIGIHESAAKLGMLEGDVIVQVPTELAEEALQAYQAGDDTYGQTDDDLL